MDYFYSPSGLYMEYKVYRAYGEYVCVGSYDDDYRWIVSKYVAYSDGTKVCRTDTITSNYTYTLIS